MLLMLSEIRYDSHDQDCLIISLFSIIAIIIVARMLHYLIRRVSLTMFYTFVNTCILHISLKREWKQN